jgi:hypothetical protein
MDSIRPTSDRASSDNIGGLARRLESAAWATFVVWAGIAMLTEVSWGWFFVGVGVITLAAQFVRWQMGLRIEGFWIICGAMFLAGGAWDLLAIRWAFAPVLLIVLGLALFWRAVRR